MGKSEKYVMEWKLEWRKEWFMWELPLLEEFMNTIKAQAPKV